MSGTQDKSVQDKCVEDEAQVEARTFEVGVQYLLADLETLREFFKEHVEIGEKRIDVYLAICSATIGGLVVLSQSDIEGRAFVYIALAVAFGLLVLGLVTYRQVIDRDILVIEYIRAINRIRRYFAEQAPQIKPYLLMPVSHEYPRYDWHSSNRRVPVVVNSLCVSLIVVLAILLMGDTTMPDLRSWILALIGFVVTYFSHLAFANRIFTRVEKAAREVREQRLFATHDTFRDALQPGSKMKRK